MAPPTAKVPGEWVPQAVDGFVENGGFEILCGTICPKTADSQGVSQRPGVHGADGVSIKGACGDVPLFEECKAHRDFTGIRIGISRDHNSAFMLSRQPSPVVAGGNILAC
jgi:hypothetical protein